MEDSSAISDHHPLNVRPIFVVASSTPVDPPCAKVIQDSKDDIISNVQRAMAKRKAILAVEESSSDVEGVDIGRCIK